MAPLARITRAHFSDSSRIQRANSAGVLAITSKPSLPSASRVSEVRIPRAVSALSIEITFSGVPAGARKPFYAQVLENPLKMV